MVMLFDNVLIKPFAKSKVQIAGEMNRIPDKGEVIAVGPGDAYGYPTFMSTSVKVGDKVRVLRDRCLEVEINGVRHYVVREREILGILGKGEE